MWDLKLFFIDNSFTIFSFFNAILFNNLDIINPELLSGSFLSNLKTLYQFPQNMSFFFGIKFLLSIFFLILIRGGTPRYRYDYLTKLGWLKFLGFIILVFLFSLLVFFIF